MAKPHWANMQDYEELVDYWFDPKMVVSIFSCSIIFYWYFLYVGFFLVIKKVCFFILMFIIFFFGIVSGNVFVDIS